MAGRAAHAHADPAVKEGARRVVRLQRDRCAECKVLVTAVATSTIEARAGNCPTTASCLRYSKRLADVERPVGNDVVEANAHDPVLGERAALGRVFGDGFTTEDPVDLVARRSCEL